MCSPNRHFWESLVWEYGNRDINWSKYFGTQNCTILFLYDLLFTHSTLKTALKANNPINTLLRYTNPLHNTKYFHSGVFGLTCPEYKKSDFLDTRRSKLSPGLTAVLQAFCSKYCTSNFSNHLPEIQHPIYTTYNSTEIPFTTRKLLISNNMKTYL